MSKQIQTPTENAAHNIFVSRQATNKSNLEDDSICWGRIVAYPNDYPFCTTAYKKGQLVFSFKVENGRTSTDKIKLKEDKNITQILNTVFSRICSNLNFNGFDTPEEIKFKDLKEMVNLYLASPAKLQIQFCRNSTRQKVDEDVQAATLAKYINDSFKTIKNGAEVIYNGKIVSKKEALKLNKEELDSRSVDIAGVVKQYQVKVFSKYAKVAGSGQSHQSNETKNWLKECVKVKEENMLFVAQLDGGEAESHIPALRTQFDQFDNIFVGNTEQIIDWLNSVN